MSNKVKQTKEALANAKPGTAEHRAAVHWFVRAFVEAKKADRNPA